MEETFFTNDENSIVTSDRVIYTPSGFARTSLIHLQEIGFLTANKPHTSSRENLKSYLFFMVVSGAGELIYDNQPHPLSAGDCVFIDCRNAYAHSTSDELWSLRWIHFYGPNLSLIYEKYLERGGLPSFHPTDLNLIKDTWQRLFSIAKSDDYIRDMKINEELNSLLTLLMNESWHQHEVTQVALKKQNVLPIKQYLEENYAKKITLDGLAEQFFISKYYMTHVFKEQFGVSVNQYLLSVRITKAKQMLRFSSEKVEAIGYACGLGSPNYFSRTFKNVEGISPSEYREKW